jgi:hypothetical protein
MPFPTVTAEKVVPFYRENLLCLKIIPVHRPLVALLLHSSTGKDNAHHNKLHLWLSIHLL